MIRISFIGVPGCGKTTTARSLAGQIRTHTHFETVELISEYARTYIHKYGIDSIYDQIRVLKKQIGQEDKYPSSTSVLITDSPIFLNFFYALSMREDGNPKHTMLINDLFKELNKYNENKRYDIVFHLPPVLKPKRDGIRSEEQFDPAWREKADEEILSIFRIFKPRHLITLHSVTEPERVQEAINHIKKIYDTTRQDSCIKT